MSINLESLNKLAGLNFPKNISADELEIGKKYPLLSLKKINTKYGENVLAEIEKGVFFLPKRLSNHLSEEFCEQYEPNKLLIIYGGKMTGIPGRKEANVFQFAENVSI